MRGITVAALLLACSAHALFAQDLEYTSTTQMKSSAALGPMAMGGRNVAVHVLVKGQKLRLELGTGATVVDARSNQIVLLDNARKTYAIMPLSTMFGQQSDSVANSFEVQVTVSPTRQSRKINGLDARLTNVVARVPARNPKAPRATDVVVVNELWTSNANGIGSTYDRLAGQADRFAGSAPMLMGLLSQNPRVGAAMQRAAREAARVHGLPVRRINAYGLIPAGSKFQPGMAMDTMLSIVTDITEVKNASLPAKLFEIPAGYVKLSPAR